MDKKSNTKTAEKKQGTNGLKKVHGGILYDMEKAMLLYTWHNSLLETQNGWTRERIYRTPKGNFFLYGESNIMGDYAEVVTFYDSGEPMYKRPGNAIVPMEKEQALDWMQERGADAEIILKYLSCLIQEA